MRLDVTIFLSIQRPLIVIPLSSSLLSKLVSHLKPGSKSPTVQELQKEWDEFVASLSVRTFTCGNRSLFRISECTLCQKNEPSTSGTSKPVWDVPSEYLELVRSAKNVMRPYHSQASELVSQCFDLVQHFKANRSANNLKLLTASVALMSMLIN
jgi:hypothetical protein